MEKVEYYIGKLDDDINNKWHLLLRLDAHLYKDVASLNEYKDSYISKLGLVYKGPITNTIEDEIQIKLVNYINKEPKQKKLKYK